MESDVVNKDISGVSNTHMGSGRVDDADIRHT